MPIGFCSCSPLFIMNIIFFAYGKRAALFSRFAFSFGSPVRRGVILRVVLYPFAGAGFFVLSSRY